MILVTVVSMVTVFLPYYIVNTPASRVGGSIYIWSRILLSPLSPL